MAIPAVVYLVVNLISYPGEFIFISVRAISMTSCFVYSAGTHRRRRLHRDIAAEGPSHRVLRGAHARDDHQRTQVADAHGHGPRRRPRVVGERAGCRRVDEIEQRRFHHPRLLRRDHVRGGADGAERVRVHILRDDAQAWTHRGPR